MSSLAESVPAERQTPADRRLTPVMFVVSLLWTAILGVAIHLLTDDHSRFDVAAVGCLWAQVALFPLFVGEALIHWGTNERCLRQNLWFVILPALRMGGRDHVDGTTVWIPFLGWREASDQLESDLERSLSIPMIVVALLVLPVIGVEHFAKHRVATDAWFALATHLAGTFIWLAFAVEFIVMASIVRSRFKYVRQHWLDLAIIILPTFAFVRVLRFGQLGRLLRLNQITRTARAFRVRGLFLRVWKGVLVLDLIDRALQRDVSTRLAKLRAQLREQELSCEQLRRRIAELEKQLPPEPVENQSAT
jgi:hypothetical protein